MMDLDEPQSLVLAARPGALLDRVLPPSLPDPAVRAAAEETERRAMDRLHARLDAGEPQTRRLLLWLDFLHATRDCRAGRLAAAASAVTRARALVAPAIDPDLEALARRCGL